MLGANYPAEYGRSLGSVLNVVYKSGTNNFQRQRLRVLPRFGVRREQLLREAGRPAARRLPAQPVRRRRRRPDPARPHVLHDLVRGAARAAPVGDDDDRADAGAAPGRLLADLRAERPADSHLRSVHDARQPGRRLHPRPVRRTTSSRSTGWIRSRARSSSTFRCRTSRATPSPARRTTSPPAPPSSNVDNFDAPRRPPALGQGEGVRPLLVPQDVQRAGDVLPRGHRHRRGAGQRAEPRAQRRHRLQPDDVEHDGAERAAGVRAHAVHLRQPGARLQAVEPRACRRRSTTTSIG